MQYTKLKSFYLAVVPIGSRFAKALQASIRERVHNQVRRVSHAEGNRQARRGRSCFHITPEPLNKIQQFNRFKASGVSHPNFCTRAEEIDQLGSKTVFARTLINSTGGRGIVEFQLQDGVQPPRAPLYTAYIHKKAEYRVHVFQQEVVDIQQKKKRRNFNLDERDTRIRNLVNGYVYTREGINPPSDLGNLAVAACDALGYHYGAVDIIYNEKRDKLYVLEVNSRPGLMGTTLDKYSNAIINWFNLRRKRGV